MCDCAAVAWDILRLFQDLPRRTSEVFCCKVRVSSWRPRNFSNAFCEAPGDLAEWEEKLYMRHTPYCIIIAISLLFISFYIYVYLYIYIYIRYSDHFWFFVWILWKWKTWRPGLPFGACLGKVMRSCWAVLIRRRWRPWASWPSCFRTRWPDQPSFCARISHPHDGEELCWEKGLQHLSQCEVRFSKLTMWLALASSSCSCSKWLFIH